MVEITAGITVFWLAALAHKLKPAFRAIRARRGK